MYTARCVTQVMCLLIAGGGGGGSGVGGGGWVSGMDDVPAQAIVFGHPYFVAFS